MKMSMGEAGGLSEQPNAEAEILSTMSETAAPTELNARNEPTTAAPCEPSADAD